jgi:hypothetical protein
MDRLEVHRGHEHGLRRLARDGFGGRAEEAGRELLVDAAVAHHHEIRHARLVTDFVRHDAGREHGLARHAVLGAALAESVEEHAPAFAQRLPHLGREVEVGLEAERSGDVVQEGALDRDDVDHVQAHHRGPQALGEPEGVAERGVRVLGPVEGDQNALDHRQGPAARV